jgi:hypothetical protein
METLLKQNKLLEIKNEQLEAKIKILEKHIDELLSVNEDNTTSYNKDMIRYDDGIKCYHGIQQHELTWLTNYDNKFNHIFWVYNNDYKWKSHHHPDKWDIKEKELYKFCDNCELDIELSKRKRTHKVYRCLGHNIN